MQRYGDCPGYTRALGADSGENHGETMTMTAEGLGFKCGFQYQENDNGLLCTLTGRMCFVNEDGGAQQCLRARWAKAFEAKHGTSILELGERQRIDATKSQELA